MKKTLIALMALAGVASADYVWNGGREITPDAWATEGNWTLTDETAWTGKGSGPGTPNSDMWDAIMVQNANGHGITLEGWALDLNLVNSQLVFEELKKLQNDAAAGSVINIDENSSLIIQKYSGGNDGGQITLNCDGAFTLHYDKNQGGTGIIADFGSTGRMVVAATRDNQEQWDFSAKIISITADLGDAGLTDPRVLVELTKGTVLETIDLDTNVTINAGEDWIRVSGEDAIVDDGTYKKYYWVTQEQSGVYLNTKIVPEPTTATLSLLALAGLAARRRRR